MTPRNVTFALLCSSLALLFASPIASVSACEWHTSAWSQCSKSCKGGGVQTRTVMCSAYDLSDPRAKSDPLGCVPPRNKNAGPEPAKTQSCNMNVKCADEQPNKHHYEVGPFSKCSVTCGAGVQIRVVKCTDKDTWDAPGAKDDAAKCKSTERPKSTQACKCETSCEKPPMECEFQDDHVLRCESTKQLYKMQSGKACKMSNEAWTSYGKPTYESVDCAKINKCPKGDDIVPSKPVDDKCSFNEGDILRCDSTTAIYKFTGGKMCTFSAAAYAAHGKPQYTSVDCTKINSCPKGDDMTPTPSDDSSKCDFKQGAVVRCPSSGGIYKMNDGKLQHFSPAGYTQANKPKSEDVSCPKITSCPKGDDITGPNEPKCYFTEGQILRCDETTAIYRFTQGKLRTFSAIGYAAQGKPTFTSVSCVNAHSCPRGDDIRTSEDGSTAQPPVDQQDSSSTGVDVPQQPSTGGQQQDESSTGQAPVTEESSSTGSSGQPQGQCDFAVNAVVRCAQTGAVYKITASGVASHYTYNAYKAAGFPAFTNVDCAKIDSCTKGPQIDDTPPANSCNYVYKTGDWSKCGAKCGVATQARSVKCICSSTGRRVDDSRCADAKPPTSQQCDAGQECTSPEFYWCTGNFGCCSATCGTKSVQMRSVTCKNHKGKIVSSDKCDQATKPPTLQTCIGLPSCSGGGVVGDPIFTALKSQQKFQVHGTDQMRYSLISSAATQINVLFTFLNSGGCPIIDGVELRTPNGICYSHPGSYISTTMIRTASGDVIELTPGTAIEGFTTATFNSQPIAVGQQIGDNDAVTEARSHPSVERINTHIVKVRTADFDLTFQSSDKFINVVTEVRDWTTVAAHGLLGQTVKDKLYNHNSIKQIEGSVNDYMLPDLMSSEFKFDIFGKHNDATQLQQLQLIGATNEDVDAPRQLQL